MKSIMENFRRVTRYGVAVLLAAASCFSASADCRANWDDDDQGWWVFCNFGDSFFVPADEAGGGGGGSCPDCTAMSPAECEAVKADIQNQASDLSDSIQNALEENNIVEVRISEVRQVITEITNEGQNFEFIAQREVIGSSAETKEYLIHGSTAPYLWTNSSQVPTQVHQYLGSNNGIYNYYNTIVGPDLAVVNGFLDELETSALNVENQLNDLLDNVTVLEGVADGMNCAACEGSGGSGGDGGGGTTPSGCPCSEYINAVKTAVDNCYTKLTEIKDKMNEWDKLLKGYKSQLDTIAKGVAYIGTNFNYAVEYRNLDGVKFRMNKLDELLNQNESTGFDFQEFGKLSWFSRVEYLLMSIAGVFSATNVTGVSQSKLDEAYSALADKKETLEANVDGVESSFTSLNNSFKSLCNSLKTGVGYGSSSPSLNLFPSWFGGRGLSVVFPSQIVSTARAVTSLFWSVLFACVLYEIILHGCLVFFDFFKFFVSSTSSVLS